MPGSRQAPRAILELLPPHLGPRIQDPAPQRRLNAPLPLSLFFQTKSEFTVEFSVSDHQGVSVPWDPRDMFLGGHRISGPLGWKRPESGGSANCLPFSCQVITRKVNIQVGDVNDNAPTFHNQPYSVRIPEVGATRVALGDIEDLLLPRPPGCR